MLIFFWDQMFDVNNEPQMVPDPEQQFYFLFLRQKLKKRRGNTDKIMWEMVVLEEAGSMDVAAATATAASAVIKRHQNARCSFIKCFLRPKINVRKKERFHPVGNMRDIILFSL